MYHSMVSIVLRKLDFSIFRYLHVGLYEENANEKTKLALATQFFSCAFGVSTNGLMHI